MDIGDKLTFNHEFDSSVTTESLTAARQWLLPNKNGTVAMTSDIGGTQRNVNTITASSNILVGDNGSVIRCNNSSAITITIPASNGYDVGFTVDIIQVNTGQVTISPGSGISLIKFGGTGNAVLIGQYARSQLIKLTTGNQWHCTGDISI